MEGGIAGKFTKTLAYTWNTLLIAVIKVELCNFVTNIPAFLKTEQKVARIKLMGNLTTVFSSVQYDPNPPQSPHTRTIIFPIKRITTRNC